MFMRGDAPLEEPSTGGPISYPDVDQHKCRLLGPTALIVQALMGLLVILSLVYKRQRETPKRPWRIWLFDVSKQVVGQLFVHGANLLVSGLTSHHNSKNACVSYFLNILIDTTFGVALIYVTHHALTSLFSETFQLEGFKSGVYGNPPSIKYWIRQATIYVLALSTMKAVVITILILFPGIHAAGRWLLSWTWTGEGDALQVIFVMGIFPILMNVLQFWLIDSIVKASGSVDDSFSSDVEHDADEDREPLFHAPEDENDHSETTFAPNFNQQSTSTSSLDANSRLEEQKSSASSARQFPLPSAHDYPPSLSSSLSSGNSSSAREAAKNQTGHGINSFSLSQTQLNEGVLS